MRFGALRGVTIVGVDLDAMTAAYRDCLDYRVVGSTSLAAAAARWERPAVAGCRTATLIPASGAATYVRLIESPVPASFVPMTSPGWAAAEMVVQDLDRTAAALADGPFEIIGPPAVLDFDFTDQLRAMQVVGPAREVLYLTEIGAAIPGFVLPTAVSPVDRVFVGILGTTNLAGAAAWYGERMGVPTAPPFVARIEVLARAHGLHEQLRHRLTTVTLPDATLIEIDEYPAATTVARPLAACGLPAGIAIISVATDDPALHGMLIEGPAGELIEWQHHREQA